MAGRASRGEIRAEPAKTCLLCAAPGETLYEKLQDRLFGVPGQWSLLCCAACGLVWLDPRPVAEDLGSLYDGYHTHGRPAEAFWLQRMVRQRIPAACLGYPEAGAGAWGRALARVGPLREAAVRSVMGLTGERRGRLLDVGCGSGIFLSTMQQLGWQVCGAETDPEAAAVAREVLGRDCVRVGDLRELSLPEEGFDAVTLSHVIEHLPDPADTLRECRRLLRPGGRLSLATPNAMSLGRERFGADWRGWEPPRHLQVFGPDSLKRMSEAAGFRLISLTTPAAAAYPLWLESAVQAGSRWSVLSRIRAVAFWLREHRRTRLGGRVGEELLLVAEKPDE